MYQLKVTINDNQARMIDYAYLVSDYVILDTEIDKTERYDKWIKYRKEK